MTTILSDFTSETQLAVTETTLVSTNSSEKKIYRHGHGNKYLYK